MEFTNFTSNPNFRPRLIGKSSPIVPRTYPAAPMFKFTQTGIFIDATNRDDNGILTKAMKFFIVPGYMNRKSYHNIVIPPSQVMLLSQNNTRIPTNQ